MTWLDLYNFLHQKANDVNNLDSEMWQSKVVFHNLDTGDECPCDTWIITDEEQEPRLVLGVNLQEEN